MDFPHSFTLISLSVIWSFDKQVPFTSCLFSFMLLDYILSQAIDLCFYEQLCAPALKPSPMHFVCYLGEYPEDRVKPEERYCTSSAVFHKVSFPVV